MTNLKEKISEINLKHPIFFLHGMGFKNRKHIGYWGRIPSVLEERGIKIYHGNQDANGSIEGNSEQLKEQLDELVSSSNFDKVNIIAHSKGGLEARYLISTLNCSNAIASLTTISTPHNGSVTVDKLMKFPQFLIRIGCKIADLFFRIFLGDKKPETYKAICGLKTEVANEFNQKNVDSEDIYYQSYAFVMKNIFSDILLWFPSLIVYMFEGPNDGLLSSRSTKWSDFKGIVKSNSRRGISHLDEVDFRRRRFTKKRGDNVSDITDLYIDIAKDLENMGY